MTSHQLVNLSNSEGTRLSSPGTHGGADITIQNINLEGNIYIGAEDVSLSSYGFRIAPNQAWSVELSGKDSIHAISELAGAQVAVLKLNLEQGS
jgi:hypothetical protein